MYPPWVMTSICGTDSVGLNVFHRHYLLIKCLLPTPWIIFLSPRLTDRAVFHSVLLWYCSLSLMMHDNTGPSCLLFICPVIQQQAMGWLILAVSSLLWAPLPAGLIRQKQRNLVAWLRRRAGLSCLAKPERCWTGPEWRTLSAPDSAIQKNHGTLSSLKWRFWLTECNKTNTIVWYL